MKMPSFSVSELADNAESLRQEERCSEALKVIEDCLKENARHPRALLLLGRILYQDGKPLEALQVLRRLDSVLGMDEALKNLVVGVEQLCKEKNSRTDPAFMTETMATLLARQGYLIEALEIYRRLYLASARESRLWEEILQLRNLLEREGSRATPGEKALQELATLNQWIHNNQRE